MRNKKAYIEKLIERTGKSQEECEKINTILESHNIIGHNNKDKIKEDFINELNLTEEEADKLYNTCSELIVKGIFGK